MGKYIDADRLKQTIADNVYPVQDAFNSRDYGMFWTGGIEKAIDEQPTADVVEVVRCNDCINDAHNEGYDVGYWAGRRDFEPKWIPCSDGLPEEDYETGNGVQFSADVLATIVNHKNDGELYVWLLKTVDGKWYDYIPNEDGSQEVPYGCEVIAWMPLPTPYKGGEEG